jgi:hypothetical protein
MSEGSLLPNDAVLVEAVGVFLGDQYEGPTMRLNEEINPILMWTPSLHFHANDHLRIAVEVSETPYPMILQMRHADLLAFREPVAVYCACPEEEFLKKDNQTEIRRLRAHGYGLITIDDKKHVTKQHSCIPLIQFIPESDFKQEIDGLPKSWRVRFKDSYDRYLVDPVSGVQHVSEVLEGLVLSAAKATARKKWTGELASKPLADILDALGDAPQCKQAKAAIGGLRNYVKQYRNPSHHYPKNKQQAYKKYQDAPHAFRDGLKQAHSFRAAMTKIGVTLSL